MQKTISLAPLTFDECMAKLGCFCSTYLANDLYYLNQANMIMIANLNAIDLNIIKEGYPAYAVKEKKFKKLTERLHEVKTWYDAIEDKKFEKKNVEVTIKRFWRKTASKVSMMQQDLIDLHVWLIMRTDIHRKTIPSDKFKILEHAGFKKLTLGKKKIEDVTEKPPES